MLKKIYDKLLEEGSPFDVDKQANAAREKFCNEYIYFRDDSEERYEKFCEFSDAERLAAFRVGFSCALELITEVSEIIDEI